MIEKYNPHGHPKRDELLNIFNITAKEALMPKIRFSRLKLNEYEEKHNKLLSLRIRSKQSNRWLSDLYLQEAKINIQKEKSRAKRLNDRKRYIIDMERFREEKEQYKTSKSEEAIVGPVAPKREYSKSEAKEYPCERILREHNIDISSSNKFKLRNENTPSCVLYRNNTAYDFGSGEYYDSIGLYQKITGCDFIEALRELTN